MAKFNKDELNPPTWMDSQFMEKVLRASETCQDVKIKGFKISPATLKGEHFASIMFRAAIQFSVKSEEKDISIIIKTMPVEDGMKKDMLEQLPIFETESAMYSVVIPRFNSILREHGDDTILGARLLYHSLSPHKVIVLEDLTKNGFTVFSNNFANFEQLQVILDKISKWHAISFKLLHEDRSLLSQFNEGVFNSALKVFHDYFSSGLECFRKILPSLPNGEIYAEKFQKIQHNLLKKCQKTISHVESLCVLNHGDFHLKNMMCKWENNNNKLEDMIPVDFQFCVVAPLIHDLIYVINIVADTESRLQREGIISTYYNKFVESLKMINFNGNIPSLMDIQNELLKHKHFELMVVATSLPLAFGAWTSGEVEPHEIITHSETKERFYTSSTYLNELKVLLPRMLEKGYFD